MPPAWNHSPGGFAAGAVGDVGVGVNGCAGAGEAWGAGAAGVGRTVPGAAGAPDAAGADGPTTAVLTVVHAFFHHGSSAGAAAGDFGVDPGAGAGFHLHLLRSLMNYRR